MNFTCLEFGKKKKKKLKTEFIDLLRVQTDESAVKMDSLVH